MPNKGHEIPTIDVELITIQTKANPTVEIGLKTATKLAVSVQSEQQDAIKLVVKGVLIAQKPQQTTITGNTLTMTDNVFNPELVKILQGGKVMYWTSAERTTKSETDAGYGVAGYIPPVAGSAEKGEIFVLNAYSAIYNAAGLITGYEKIIYPNCQGVPVALNSEDNVFRVPEYTINSAPDTGEAPYEIEYVTSLPALSDVPKGE